MFPKQLKQKKKRTQFFDKIFFYLCGNPYYIKKKQQHNIV